MLRAAQAVCFISVQQADNPFLELGRFKAGEAVLYLGKIIIAEGVAYRPDCRDRAQTLAMPGNEFFLYRRAETDEQQIGPGTLDV